jgi:drug/metabolite transporter (DMT)-like permease
MVPQVVLTLITMLWGASFLVVQTALTWAGAFTVVGLRFGLAGVIFALAVNRRLRGFSRQDAIAGIPIGIGLFLGYSLQTLGLQTIASSKSAFLSALYVPLVPILQWLVWQRVPKVGAALGILVAFTGTVLLTSRNGFDVSLGRGEVLTIVGALAMAAEILLIGFFSKRCAPLRVTLVQLLTVAVLALSAAVATGEPLPQWHPMFIACLVGLAAATALIQFGMNWAQAFVPATKATLIYAMEPVWAALVGAIAGERLGLWQGAGGALIVLAVVLGEVKFPRRAVSSSRALRN